MSTNKVFGHSLQSESFVAVWGQHVTIFLSLPHSFWKACWHLILTSGSHLVKSHGHVPGDLFKKNRGYAMLWKGRCVQL
jgi:hypothetical protein